MPFLIALGLAGALIQSPVAPPGAAVSGRVIEERTRAPIPGTQVTLIPSRPGRRPFPVGPLTTTTDQDGHYEFRDVEAGRYRVMVQKAGFARPHDMGFPEVDLTAGERRANVTVTLQKGAVIVGRVLDETGDPLIDARVVAMRKPTAASNAISTRLDFLMPGGPGVQTNDLGEFRLFSLAPGDYYVQAMAQPDFGSPAQRPTTMLPTYFPGTTDPAAAHPVGVGAGQTSAEIVIRMIGVPAFQVTGVVRDEAGRPVANAMVKVVMDEPAARPAFMGGPWNQSRTDSSGKFAITNVTNGTYTLLASAPVVISGPSHDDNAARAGAGGVMTWGTSGVVGGTTGGGVTTKTSNGKTIQYRDDTATRVPITVNDSNVIGLEVIVKAPARPPRPNKGA